MRKSNFLDSFCVSLTRPAPFDDTNIVFVRVEALLLSSSQSIFVRSQRRIRRDCSKLFLQVQESLNRFQIPKLNWGEDPSSPDFWNLANLQP